MEIKLDSNGTTIGTVSVAKPEKKKTVVVKVRPQSADERSLAKTVHQWNFNPVAVKSNPPESGKVGQPSRFGKLFSSFRVKKW